MSSIIKASPAVRHFTASTIEEGLDWVITKLNTK